LRTVDRHPAGPSVGTLVLGMRAQCPRLGVDAEVRIFAMATARRAQTA